VLEGAGSGFAHKAHFEDNDVSDECGSCHKLIWHVSQTIESSVCLDCHEQSEVQSVVSFPEPVTAADGPPEQEGARPGKDGDAAPSK
jgi:hypothetical protein